MALRPKDLAVLVEGRTGKSSPPVSYPGPSGVLYAPPNPDRTGKSCSNCTLWAEKDLECLIHPKTVSVDGDDVCGYHVFGPPQLFATAIMRGPGIDPKLSGLIDAPPGGTSCSTCRFFTAPSTCGGVANPDTGMPPTKVEPLGCCARWEQKQ